MAAAGSGKNIEEFLPGVKYNGLNTAKAVDFSSATSVALPAGTTVGGALNPSGDLTVTSATATALSVGANGTTNPQLQVDASASTVANGVKVTGTAAGSNAKIVVISSGTNENLNIDGKGSGQIILNATATGGVVTQRFTTLANGLTAATAGGVKITTFGNSGPSICTGSGAPTVSSGQGSIYMRTDGSSTSTRLYVNTDGSTTWTAITTAS